jgi:hypothetical protein
MGVRNVLSDHFDRAFLRVSDHFFWGKCIRCSRSGRTVSVSAPARREISRPASEKIAARERHNQGMPIETRWSRLPSFFPRLEVNWTISDYEKLRRLVSKLDRNPGRFLPEQDFRIIVRGFTQITVKS